MCLSRLYSSDSCAMLRCGSPSRADLEGRVDEQSSQTTDDATLLMDCPACLLCYSARRVGVGQSQRGIWLHAWKAVGIIITRTVELLLLPFKSVKYIELSD